MAQPHKILVDEIITAVQRRLGDRVRIFKRPVGLMLTLNGSPLKVGVPGQCDIYGYIRRDPYGRPFEIEAKYGRDNVKDDQESWHNTLHSLKVSYVVIRAIERKDIKDAGQHAADYVEQLAGGL